MASTGQVRAANFASSSALGDLADEDVRFAFLAVGQDSLARVLVFLESVPLCDTLEHPDAGVPVVLDAHIRHWSAAGKSVAPRVAPRDRHATRNYPDQRC